jgi:hypothetical protein
MPFYIFYEILLEVVFNFTVLVRSFSFIKNIYNLRSDKTNWSSAKNI